VVSANVFGISTKNPLSLIRSFVKIMPRNSVFFVKCNRGAVHPRMHLGVTLTVLSSTFLAVCFVIWHIYSYLANTIINL
jgi:hypothetical protein